ncbi:MAG: NADH-quinone oxidoreductase subunit J [Rhodospirillaceae bacterium]|nr:MAG: NADH-quinone oxidoreductase subunit J [Rhodospirillaceae bacterium]
MVASLAFYLFSFMAIIGALNVIFQRNPVHSVLWLIFTFFNAAGLFVLLGAEFVAMILVVVYVGAVAVLFLFVVMMLDVNVAMLREGFLRYMPVGAVIGIVLLVELAVVMGGWAFAPSAHLLSAAPTPDMAQVSNTQALGALLYTKYVYLFQVSGIILLVAMIGSIVLTLRRRPDSRKQVIADQVARRAEDTLEVVKVQTGQGVAL